MEKVFKKSSSVPVVSLSTFEFVNGVDFSDHASFWEVGLPAVMITDTAFYRYPYYHSAQDTADKVKYGKLAELTESLYAAILEMVR